MATNTNAIAVDALVKRYPKATANAVDGVSFAVPQGEIFGLLGPNGAGKTTTIGVLTTFVLPTSGQARLMGIDVTRDPMRVKQHLAVVPQQSNLDRSLRVRDILLFHAAYHGMSRAEREQRAAELLAELGLSDRAKDRVTAYSGGMIQRLMIARALMHSPDVLFLDEPTNNLDPQSRLYLWDRIKDLNTRGLTILLTTHDMDEADLLCQRIAIMDHGKILALDTPAELKKLIPGGISLELRAQVPAAALAGATSASADGQAGSAILTALRALPGVDKVEEIAVTDGGQQGVSLFRLFAEDAGTLTVGAIQAISTAGGELRDLHLARPSLEDVFIYLTGRNLR
ncbi:MAG TPA: ABC transporter ATP-binding protein [Ktedonobacterales bacterium]|nr:ABC transporter ATP-binding protein [Ktedonobacterales bacterium]